MAKAVRFYLSGPMSGYPDFNYAAFETAARRLRERGLEVVSPHELPNGDWNECLKRDLTAMLECDAIVLLDGWPQSRGARLELQMMLGLDRPVYLYEPHGVLRDMNRVPA